MGSHDFIRFPPIVQNITPKSWLLLGEIQSKIGELKNLPIPPDQSNNLRRIYLIKGAHSTTAIEGNSFSEDEVAKIVNKEMEAPPSRQYQQQQIDNMVEAFNIVFADHFSGEVADFSLDLLHSYHRLILKDLGQTLSDVVEIGAFRRYRVEVGRYLAAPPEECFRLMRQYCDWLNEEYMSVDGFEVAGQVVKAIVAHVYFAWIHPYGDGNGRMARLIEFAILLRAGVPDVAAHLLSNFYNNTRDMYYRMLQESHGEFRDGAYPKEANLHDFLQYSLQGFKDELDTQFKQIHDLQLRTIWHDVIHAQFRREFSEQLTVSRQRQKRLILDLTDHRFGQTVGKNEIPDVSLALTRAYADKTGRTVQRDLNELERIGLLKRVDQGYQPNTDILIAFVARSRDNG